MITFDVRTGLLCVMIILIICLICSDRSSSSGNGSRDCIDLKSLCPSSEHFTFNQHTKPLSSLTRRSIDDVPEIQIDDKLFEQMVDIVTQYSMMKNTVEEKYILICMATFHLFDMNYDYEMIDKLDKKLQLYPYIPNHVEYPAASMHRNLQKAIITHLSKQIEQSDKQLTHDFEKDRQLIHLYLLKLFTSIGVYI